MDIVVQGFTGENILAHSDILISTSYETFDLLDFDETKIFINDIE